MEILEIYGRKSSIVKCVDVSRGDPFWLVVWEKYCVYTHDVLCWEAQTQNINFCNAKLFKWEKRVIRGFHAFSKFREPLFA